VKEQIRAIRRNFVPNVMELVSAAERKAEATALSDEELEEALANIERGAAEALREANAATTAQQG
jgi:pantoate kinase